MGQTELKRQECMLCAQETISSLRTPGNNTSAPAGVIQTLRKKKKKEYRWGWVALASMVQMGGANQGLQTHLQPCAIVAVG